MITDNKNVIGLQTNSQIIEQIKSGNEVTIRSNSVQRRKDKRKIRLTVRLTRTQICST